MPRDGDGIFTRKNRPGFWISYKDAAGRRHQRRVEARNMEEAKNALGAERLRAEQARTLGFAPPTEMTFAEAAVQFLKHQKARISPAEYDRQRGIVEDHLKPFFRGELKAIRRPVVQRYVSTRCGEVEPGTVIKELNTLKHLLRLASEEWEYIPTNPARGVRPPKAPAGRVRYLHPGELRAVLEACPMWLRPIAGLLVFTGMRRSEVLNLRWLDVDRQGGRIVLPQTKNGEGRIVYLNRLAGQVLDSLRSGAPLDRVFPASDEVTAENVSVAFLRACRKAGIMDFRLHDLRHTAASWLRMRGADLQDVAELLGHRDLRMTKRYSHLSPAHLGKAVRRLDATFKECGPYVAMPKRLSEGVAASALQ